MRERLADPDVLFAIDKLLELGILDVAGLKRFAELIKTVWALAPPPNRRAPGGGPGRPAKLAAIGAEQLLAALRTKALKDVAKDHGVDRNTVRCRLRELGISYEAGVRKVARLREELKLSDEELRHAAATKSTKAIAAEHGVRLATVLARLRLLGLKAPRTRRLSASPEELRELYKTKSAEEIAKAYGVTTGTARKRLSDLRIGKPGRRRFDMGEAEASASKPPRSAWLSLTRDDLARLYGEKAAGEIAREFGVSPTTVSIRMAKEGIKKPAHAHFGSPNRAWLALSEEELRRAYAQRSAAEIAREHGISASAVANRMARLGIRKRQADRAAEEVGAVQHPLPSVEATAGDARAAVSPSPAQVAPSPIQADNDAGGVWFMPENHEQRQPRASGTGNGNGSQRKSGSNGAERSGKHWPAGNRAARVGSAPADATKAEAAGPMAEWLALGREELRRLYAEKSSREIAERYGVSAKSVRRRMARLGMGKAAGDER